MQTHQSWVMIAVNTCSTSAHCQREEAICSERRRSQKHQRNGSGKCSSAGRGGSFSLMFGEMITSPQLRMPQYTNVSVRQTAAKVACSGGLQPSLDDLSIIELPHRSRRKAHPQTWTGTCREELLLILTDSFFLSQKWLQQADGGRRQAGSSAQETEPTTMMMITKAGFQTGQNSSWIQRRA